MVYNSPYSSTTMGGPLSTPDRPYLAPRTPLPPSRPSDYPPWKQLLPSPAPTTTSSSSPGPLSTTRSAVNTPSTSFLTPLPPSHPPLTPPSASASPPPLSFRRPDPPPTTPLFPPSTGPSTSPHICTLCSPPKALATNGTLQRHINTIHLYRSFKCTRCTRVCSSQTALDRHTRDNLCSSIVECSMCRGRNQFKSQAALEKHILTGHQEEFQAAMGLMTMRRSAEKVNLCPPEPEDRDTESEFEDWEDMEL